jgi:hypothetical protein
MTWWQRLWGRARLEAELEKERRFHLDQQTADLVEEGLSPVRRGKPALPPPRLAAFFYLTGFPSMSSTTIGAILVAASGAAIVARSPTITIDR